MSGSAVVPTVERTDNTTNPASRTSAVTVLSSPHGRERRLQRAIGKRDLQAAVKYGVKEPAISVRGVLRWKYTFGDVVYITDETSRKEVTSWPVPGAGIDIEHVPITPEMQKKHDIARTRIRDNASSWTSHTVMVVDQSGSMRKLDVPGHLTRSDAVWLNIAMEFIWAQLERGEAGDTDVVSVVGMNESSSLLIDREPLDWILYNKVVHLLGSSTPVFDGNYLPCIDEAERLLNCNPVGSCALMLVFLSDGKPSDRIPAGFGSSTFKLSSLACDRMSKLASKFGRRLNFRAIGFAAAGEDFSVLKSMARNVVSYDCVGSFQALGLSMEALGSAFSTIRSSLTATRTELTAVDRSSQRAVRQVTREPRGSHQDVRLSDGWIFYPAEQVKRHEWSFDTNNWVAVDFCTSNISGIAVRKWVFGEGAERMVKYFREVGANGVFVGPVMVAKDSRFVENHTGEDAVKFHKVFCQTQIKSQHLAEKFNRRLNEISGVTPTTPRVRFLDCSVYAVYNSADRVIKDIKDAWLVESLLEGHYKKWNNNVGYVDGQVDLPMQAERPASPIEQEAELDRIQESDEEESSGNDDEDDEAVPHSVDAIRIEDSDIPQAFSHFSYHVKSRRMMVCDLQGVLNTACSPPVFELTDPVIHYASSSGRTNVYGRTDRGKKGMHKFFATHKCTDLCRRLKLQLVDPNRLFPPVNGSHPRRND